MTVRRVQVEAGFFRTQVGSQATTSYGDVLIRYGVSEQFELRLFGLSYGVIQGATEWLDPSLGFKYRLHKGREEVTFIGQTTVAVGAGALRSNVWNPTAKIAWTTPLGGDTLGGNVVIGRIGGGTSRFDQFAASLFLSRPVSSSTALTAELWAVDRVAKGARGGAFASLAATCLVDANTQLDLRIGTGFNSRRDGWFLQGGVSFRF